MELQRVSTNATLILRIVFPVLWIAFFAAFTALALILNPEEVPMMQSPIFKIGLILFFLIGIICLRITVMRLKRVDMSKDFVFVTNYLRTYKYTYDSIAHIDELDFLIFKVVKIRLKEKGSFGRRLFFIPSRTLWTGFIGRNPEIFRSLIEND